jgi:predicted secreted protein
MRNLSLFGVLSLTALTLGPLACAGADAQDPAPVNDPASTSDGAAEEIKASLIGEESNGKTIDVALGRSFTIGLASNASTGYRWHVKSVDKTLGQPKESTVAGDVTRPGSGGVQKFTWSTKSPLDLVGKHVISLEYQRPWAETSPPAQTFKVTINITNQAQGKVCGGLIGATCAKGQYCEYTAAQACGMGDQQGVCQTSGAVCPQFVLPVCGCDNKTYGNSCFANVAGTSVAHAGACVSK